ncbi:molybdopterin-guanine dinucleotide biosynthesis protein B [Paenibacillus sp. NFR01]|uniref:molybdopterin-guanine dinucleotide biosynthesis protein B n=1 Tax=Paenibacillus sp. NFR01 TaxID=1566279 RepID=UPI0008AB6B04|nr:molybdopterin-guanine dinucleotide biosynthesis protein B [Paenibacillus sp. NFR01]SET05712.1 molybdopterin-guanine dinucleotide biosynthesis protein B [Paenibacillus sp. NFR01]
MTAEWNPAPAQSTVPVLQIVGYKNSGKTTLACRLIQALSQQGIRVGSAKHDAHHFELDDPGTDSSKHLHHGAIETVLTSQNATRAMRKAETSLEEIAKSMAGRADLLIAEGFKSAGYPKIALIRDAEEMNALRDQATNIRLWISWEKNISVNPVTASLGVNTPLVILPLMDEALVDQAILSLAMSLLCKQVQPD